MNRYVGHRSITSLVRLTRRMAAAVALSACFYRTALRETAVAPGTAVRVTLTNQASQDLIDLLGDKVHTLDGRVVRSGADSLVIAVTRVVRVDDSAVVWQGERVALSRMPLAVVDRRHMSLPATALLVG